MKKLILLIVVASLFSCKTKEIVRIQYTKDSTETVQLSGKIGQLENELYQKNQQLSEQRKENERLQSNTSVVIERYDTSRDTIRLKEKVFVNRTETSEKDSQFNKEMTEYLTSEIERVYEMNVELNRKVDLLESEKTEVKKTAKPKFQWGLILVGFFIGLAFYYYLNRLVAKIKISL